MHIAKVEKVLGRCHVCIFTKEPQVTDKIQNTLKYSVDEIGYLVKKVTSIGETTEVELVGGVKYTIKESDVVEELCDSYKNKIQVIWWGNSGKAAVESYLTRQKIRKKFE